METQGREDGAKRRQVRREQTEGGVAGSIELLLEFIVRTEILLDLIRDSTSGLHFDSESTHMSEASRRQPRHVQATQMLYGRTSEHITTLRAASNICTYYLAFFTCAHYCDTPHLTLSSYMCMPYHHSRCVIFLSCTFLLPRHRRPASCTSSRSRGSRPGLRC